MRSVQRIAGGDQFALSLGVEKAGKGLERKDEGGRKTGRQLNADTHAHLV